MERSVALLLDAFQLPVQLPATETHMATASYLTMSFKMLNTRLDSLHHDLDIEMVQLPFLDKSLDQDI